MKLSEIHINPNNPRLIKDERFKKLCKSIEEFPKMMVLRPIIIDTEGMILGGNMRFKALKELGYKDIPDEWVKRDGDLTEAEKQRFIIADNIGFGEYDWDVLANEWDKDELLKWGLELPVYFGNEVNEDDYQIPDNIETDIVLGDLFEIGESRLLCGDSIIADDVDKLLAQAKPQIMVTDPPYGVEYDPEWRVKAGVNKNMARLGKVDNDNKVDWRDAYSLSPSIVFYIWHAGRYAHIVAQNIEDCGFEIRNQIIWRKKQFALSRGNYHWQHEPCWYAVKKGNKSNWIGDRSQSTVWDIGREDDKGFGHGAQKPIESMSRPIKNHIGDVYDPFIGSGTTMVACHQLNRKCYGMEIDPKYCQVIIDRMRKLDPDIVIKKNGVLI